MAAVDTAAQRQSSPIALPGPDRVLILAGKLGQQSTDEICREAKGKHRSFNQHGNSAQQQWIRPEHHTAGPRPRWAHATPTGSTQDQNGPDFA